MKRITLVIFLISVLISNISAQDNKNSGIFNPDSIKIIEIAPFSYIALEMTGSYNQQDAAYTKLWEESTKQFLDYDYSFFAIYYNSASNTPEDKLKWEVATKLVDDEEVLAPLKKEKWDYKSIAKAPYNGTFGKALSDAYAKSYAWIGQHGYKVIGPVLQKHLNQPQPNAQGELVGMVELWFPVTKSK